MIAKMLFGLFIELIFWAGIASAFMRTSDLFQMFAPGQFGGYSTDGWYGILCAVSVESLILIAKYYYLLDPNRENKNAHEFSVKAGVAAWILSFTAQGLDGVFVRQAADTLNPLVRDVVFWLLPSVPLVVSGVLMLFGAQILGGNVSAHPTKPKAESDTLVSGLFAKVMPKGGKPAESPKVSPPKAQTQAVEAVQPTAQTETK